VEGLVHISELAQHHVENPREVVNQGDTVKVKILEIDSERRRLSLSVKRVEDQILPTRSAGDGSPGAEIGGADLSNVPELGLSEDVFSGAEEPTEPAAPEVEPEATLEDAAAVEEPEAAVEDAAAPADELEAVAEDAAEPAEEPEAAVEDAAPEGEEPSPDGEETSPPAE
jgi:small subunit ribosomal protein S1